MGRDLEGDGNSSGSALSQRGGSAAPRRGKEWEPLVQCLWNVGFAGKRVTGKSQPCSYQDVLELLSLGQSFGELPVSPVL